MNSSTQLNRKFLAVAGFFAIAPSINAVSSLNDIPHVPLAAALLVAGGAIVFAALSLHQGLIALSENDYFRARIAIGFVGAVMLSEFAAQWLFAWTHGDRSFAQDMVMAIVYSFLALGASVCIALETWRAWSASAVASGFKSRNRAQAPGEIKTKMPDVALLFDEIAMRNPKWTQRLILEESFKEYDRLGGKPRKIETGWVDELPADKVGRPALPATPPADATITATVTNLTSVSADDPRVEEYFEVAQRASKEYAEDHAGKAIPRDEMVKALRAAGAKGSDLNDLASALKRELKSA